LLLFAAWSDGKSDDPWPTPEKFLEEHDKNKDGVVTLDEFDEASRISIGASMRTGREN
jgi:hypothetical protein